MGLAALILALLGLAANLDSRDARLLGATVVGGLLFALGSFSVFHGVAYLAIPTVEKASMPQMAMAIAQFGIAVLAAYGLEALHGGAGFSLQRGLQPPSEPGLKPALPETYSSADGGFRR